MSASDGPQDLASGSGSLVANSYHLELIKLLEIDPELARYGEHTTSKGLAWNYKKFLSYQAAFKKVDSLHAEGKWPDSLKRPSPTELVDIYMSHSFWYSHVFKSFGNISHHPLMVEWLEHGDGDEPSDYDVWHLVKPVYTFKELGDWLKNGGTLDLDVKKKLERVKDKGKKRVKDKAKVVLEDDVEMEGVKDKKEKGKRKEKQGSSQVATGSGVKKSHKRK